MLHRKRIGVLSACVIAASAAAAGVAGTRLLAADKPHEHAAAAAAPAPSHAADVKAHLGMANDADGAAMLKQSMTMMAAHQIVLHEIQDNPETKQLLQQAMQDPKVQALVREVKAELADPAKREAKKAEVKKDHKEMMMTLAHALMRQDPEMKKLMKEDHEAGKH